MNRLRLTCLLLTLAILTGCSISPYRNGYPSEDSWAVLPVRSLDSSEKGIQIERMLKVQLAAKGIKQVSLPPDTEVPGSNNLLVNAHRLKNAETWAKQHNVKLAMTGSIDNFTTDENGRFQIGVTLNLMDINTGKNVWVMSGESSGESSGDSGDDFFKVTRKLLNTLLKNLPLTGTTMKKVG